VLLAGLAAGFFVQGAFFPAGRRPLVVAFAVATALALLARPPRGADVRFSVMVQAQSGGKAFRKGTGFARADIFGCTNTFCGDETDIRTISIVR